MSDPLILGLIAISFLLAGAIKGAVGMGLPTAAMGLMTLVLDPRTAISLILMPMLLSNAWQVYRSGQIPRAFRTYLPFAAALMIGVAVTVSLSRNAPDRVLMALLGGAILIFVAVNASRWAPRIPDHRDHAAQMFTGAFAGIMGGVTSVWAPPMAVYLAARGVAKDEFVRASGLLIFLGSLPLAIGYLGQGFLDRQLGLMSLAMLVPTFAGFAFGESLRHRLSETGFKRFLLIVFALMGLNLIRRAVV
ncbi:MAG: sulfite exporter TauE/SafE family protein [Rhodobacter sp.]|nr:sulfite exporter TauE/SafE family protein [Rhodobacter sp.]